MKLEESGTVCRYSQAEMCDSKESKIRGMDGTVVTSR